MTGVKMRAAGLAGWLALALALPARAASQDECAVWICLPGGFPAGCGAAYAAMIDRVKRGKSPLPAFGACAVNPPRGSGSHMSAAFGYSAFIPAHRECARTDWHYENTKDDPRSYCAEWRYLPDQYIKNASCRRTSRKVDNEWVSEVNPPFCTTTYHFAEVFIEGVLAGETVYFLPH